MQEYGKLFQRKHEMDICGCDTKMNRADIERISSRLVADGKIVTAEELFIFYLDTHEMAESGTFCSTFPAYVQSYYGDEGKWETVAVIQVVLLTAAVLCIIL